jgi:hypothetical protein
MLEIEGTWDENVARSAELAGRRLRVTVLDGTNIGGGTAMAPGERLAASLRELEKDDADMPFSSPANSVELVREARSGAMYGDDLCE